MGCRRRGLQDRSQKCPLLKTGLDDRGDGRRSTIGDVWSVVDGSSFASATCPSCAKAAEWHQAIATSMGPGLSVESRRVEGLEEQEQEQKQQEQEQGGCSRRSLRWNGDLNGGWRLAGNRLTSVVLA